MLSDYIASIFFRIDEITRKIIKKQLKSNLLSN